MGGAGVLDIRSLGRLGSGTSVAGTRRGDPAQSEGEAR